MEGMINKIICGDSWELARQLPDESLNCIITSPPYWNLRDYQIDSQFGLESTPEEYVSKLVALFRELKRALKKDGTVWLNLGDSYAGSGQGRNGDGSIGELSKKQRSNRGTVTDKFRHGIGDIPGLKPKDLCGIPWRVAFALQQSYEEHLIKLVEDRAYIAGLVDGEGCITILKTKSANSENSFSYPPIVQIRMCDTGAIDYFAELIKVNRSEAELYNSQKDANQRASYNVKAVAQKAMDLIADIYPFLKVKRKQAIVAYNHQLIRSKTNYQPRSEEQIKKEEFCKELINKLNQRELTEIPSWMVEPKVKTETGWFLRQDLIWHKPNPMPESVTDRCTKSHEYIFLLSKSKNYYYDYEAIKEPDTPDGRKQTIRRQTNRYVGKLLSSFQDNAHERWTGTRNKRSVWTVNTHSFSEAHFATFPQKLIEPMVMAGCPAGGLILDPFMGAGTTAFVAKKLNRNYIGFELNPEYIKIAERRLVQEVLPL